MPRPSLAALLVALGMLTSACADPVAPPPADAGADAAQAAKKPKKAKITVDGVIGDKEWESAASLPFMASTATGLVPATLYAITDGTDLYLAVRVQRASVADEHRWLAFEFDNDDDGSVFEPNDDGLFVGGPAFLTGIGDEHRAFDQFGSFTQSDGLAGGTSDGTGAMGGDATSMTWELSHPLNSGDQYDFAITATAPTVGVYFDLRIPIGTSNDFNLGDHTLTSVAAFGGWCRLQALPTAAFLGCPAGMVASVRITRDPATTVIAPLTFEDSDDTHQLGLSTYDYQGNPVASPSCFWFSTNEGVATVTQAGVLSTVAPGTTAILSSCKAGAQALETQGAVAVTVVAAP